MSVSGVFLRAVALGAAAHAFVSSSSNTTACAPILDSPSSAAAASSTEATRDLLDSTKHLDTHLQWDVEADDFGGGYRAATAQLQILRLRTDYTDAQGNAIPVMRIVGFFPGVSTTTVYQHLTDLKLRRDWDANYTLYERFSGDFSGTLQEASLCRPLNAVAKKTPQCDGDVCTLVPDVTTTAFDHGWFCHRVGSAALRRFGLVDRLFQYERLSHACSFRAHAAAVAPPAVPPLTLYDILFSGSRGARAAAASASPSLSAWLTSKRTEDGCEEVDVNFQHILLLPIADAEAQLFGDARQLRRLCTMGSMLDEESTRLVYGVFKDTKERTEQSRAPLPGTLLVMTSANNVRVPAFLPRWVQKTISGSVSRKAYGQLMAACVASPATTSSLEL